MFACRRNSSRTGSRRCVPLAIRGIGESQSLEVREIMIIKIRFVVISLALSQGC